VRKLHLPELLATQRAAHTSRGRYVMFTHLIAATTQQHTPLLATALHQQLFSSHANGVVTTVQAGRYDDHHSERCIAHPGLACLPSFNNSHDLGADRFLIAACVAPQARLDESGRARQRGGPAGCRAAGDVAGRGAVERRRGRRVRGQRRQRAAGARCVCWGFGRPAFSRRGATPRSCMPGFILQASPGLL